MAPPWLLSRCIIFHVFTVEAFTTVIYCLFHHSAQHIAKPTSIVNASVFGSTILTRRKWNETSFSSRLHVREIFYCLRLCAEYSAHPEVEAGTCLVQAKKDVCQPRLRNAWVGGTATHMLPPGKWNQNSSVHMIHVHGEPLIIPAKMSVRPTNRPPASNPQDCSPRCISDCTYIHQTFLNCVLTLQDHYDKIIGQALIYNHISFVSKGLKRNLCTRVQFARSFCHDSISSVACNAVY